MRPFVQFLASMCVCMVKGKLKYFIIFFFQKIEKLPAKLLMPKQFVGCSCLIKNLQQASRTVDICSKEEAGKSTWKIKQQKINHLFLLSYSQDKQEFLQAEKLVFKIVFHYVQLMYCLFAYAINILMALLELLYIYRFLLRPQPKKSVQFAIPKCTLYLVFFV